MSDRFESVFETKEKIITKKPSMYKVIMLNDHYTTMDFVVDTLIEVFGKKEEEAVIIMLDIHKKGAGLCGVYTYEIAETKIQQVREKAQNSGFPLMCSMEKE